jgi:hypothetical protein
MVELVIPGFLVRRPDPTAIKQSEERTYSGIPALIRQTVERLVGVTEDAGAALVGPAREDLVN